MNSVLPANEKIVYCSKRKKKRFCDHCDRLVSIRTFNAHKRRKTVDTEKLVSQCDFEWLLFAATGRLFKLSVDVLLLSY